MLALFGGFPTCVVQLGLVLSHFMWLGLASCGSKTAHAELCPQFASMTLLLHPLPIQNQGSASLALLKEMRFSSDMQFTVVWPQHMYRDIQTAICHAFDHDLIEDGDTFKVVVV